MLAPAEQALVATALTLDKGGGNSSDASSLDRKRARPQDTSIVPPAYARKKVASEISFEFQSLSLSSAHGTTLPRVLSDNDGKRPPSHNVILPVSGVQRPPPLSQPIHHHQHERQQHDTFHASAPSNSSSSSSSASSPAACSPYSPISPQLSRPPSALAFSAIGQEQENEQSMVLETVQGKHDPAVDFGQNMEGNDVHAQGTRGSTPARTLNMRQRKWNSVLKEWQEWHEVQATHTASVPPSTSAMTHLEGGPHTEEQQQEFLHGQPEEMELLTSSPLDADKNKVQSRSPEHNFYSDPHMGDPSLQENIHGKQSTRGHGHGQGHGRQRSLHESRERMNEEFGGKRATEQEQEQHQLQRKQEPQRYPVNTRARSFSETCIYPYTQQYQQKSLQQSVQTLFLSNEQQLQQQLQQQQQQLQQQQQQQQQHHHQHQERLQQQQQSLASQRFQSRTHENGAGLRTRPRQGHDGSDFAEQRFPPSWTSLTMTSLDGISRPGPSQGSSRGMSSVPSSPHMGPTSGGRFDDFYSWTQQLLQSQGVTNVSVQPRPSSHSSHQNNQHQQPQHHAHYHNHHYPYHGMQDDVSMGEEVVTRGFLSRSSSPTPCLSMVPAVNRPLSLSISQLVGSQLEDLAEHEDDMEL
ncbi:hypothetical protein BGZ94_004974 [Podila epigama]|nr:hypothetical protein BGZ94_004974 [Podila epigama]